MNTNSSIIEITHRETKNTAAVNAHISNQIHKLERHFGHITKCHVVLQHETPKAKNGGLYRVSITAHVPMTQPFFSKSTLHHNLYASIAEAITGLQRQLKHHKRCLHDHGASKSMLQRGVIRDLFPHQGYGFIVDNNGSDYYFNSDHVNNNKFDSLKVGQTISFTQQHTPKGLQARKIKPCRGSTT